MAHSYSTVCGRGKQEMLT